ncbi:MAG TPA: hypothetical protein VEF53_06705 [Patescibacteria group bacterium]|nr:hypothetical protein [Patescibacteria group bacterium]
MYKALYFTPKYKVGTYKKFIENFKSDFNLEIIKLLNKSYILENKDMIVRLKPRFAEVFIYNDDNLEEIKKVKDYFYTN